MKVTSARDWEEFITGRFWSDIADELQIWLGDIQTNLEDPNDDLSDKTLHRLGGCAKSIREVLSLPHRFIEAINQDMLDYDEQIEKEDRDAED